MTDLDIERKLKDAVEASVPDVLDNILSRCEVRKGSIIGMNEMISKRKTENSKKWIKPLCATAAALVLVAGGAFGIGQYNLAHAVDTVVTMDVNPSIELSANKAESIIDAIALNEDGKKILEGMDLKGMKLEDAASELANSLVEEGYVSELANSILVSVINDDSEKTEDLEKRLTETVNKALSENGIDGAILGMKGKNDETLKQLAGELGISEGKANLIKSIIEKDPSLSLEELSKLNVNDLSLIAKKWIGQLEGLTMMGTPSDKKYIGADMAASNAEAHAKLSIDGAAKVESQMDYENGKLVYNVKMTTENSEFYYGVDAETGEILKRGVNTLKSAVENGIGTDNSPVGNTPVPSPDGQSAEAAKAAAEDLIKKAIDMSGTDASYARDVNVNLGTNEANSESQVNFKSGDLEYSYSFDSVTGGLKNWVGSQIQK
ncbi:MAG: hypothetical protein GXY01_09650 [Clostridiales bacterium]|jgi:uncharacterized membrane protein YkoI|nr:hypothetical protein [Clostridiales bacterium]